MKKLLKKSLGSAWLFYVLIAFEIIYMISPFGIYYYSVYGKGLNFLNSNSTTSWLTEFFLPHVAKTSSPLLNNYKEIGWLLAVTGFICFLICAGQIYYSKLFRKGVVTRGIYNYIRHPQYLFLSICSLGLLLAWPRYLILVIFILMLFAYYLLAKHEERECENKFGENYLAYKERTHMFMPFPLPYYLKLFFPEIGIIRYTSIFLTIFLSVIIAVISANVIKQLSINYLYISYSNNTATISLSENTPNEIDKILKTALSDQKVNDYIKTKLSPNEKLLNYIYPSSWFFADIPMSIPDNPSEGHAAPDDYDRNLYTVLITEAVIMNDKQASGKDILLETVKRIPILEAKIDLSGKKVVQVLYPPENLYWGNIPTPLY